MTSSAFFHRWPQELNGPGWDLDNRTGNHIISLHWSPDDDQGSGHVQSCHKPEFKSCWPSSKLADLELGI